MLARSIWPMLRLKTKRSAKISTITTTRSAKRSRKTRRRTLARNSPSQLAIFTILPRQRQSQVSTILHTRSLSPKRSMWTSRSILRTHSSLTTSGRPQARRRSTSSELSPRNRPRLTSNQESLPNELLALQQNCEHYTHHNTSALYAACIKINHTQRCYIDEEFSLRK